MSSSLGWSGIAAGLFLLGCADRTPPPPPAPALPAAAVSGGTLPPLRVRAFGTQSPGLAPLVSAQPRKLPAPVAMPNGGFRIDLRGGPGHVRTLERQPDGSFKQACRNAPVAASGGKAP
jgi:hypothetical protein